MQEITRAAGLATPRSRRRRGSTAKERPRPLPWIHAQRLRKALPTTPWLSLLTARTYRLRETKNKKNRLRGHPISLFFPPGSRRVAPHPFPSRARKTHGPFPSKGFASSTGAVALSSHGGGEPRVLARVGADVAFRKEEPRSPRCRNGRCFARSLARSRRLYLAESPFRGL